MTPQDIVRSIGDKPVELEKLETSRPPRYYSMMGIKRIRAKNGIARFVPFMYWDTCRETVSGFIRRRNMGINGSYNYYTGRRSYWGGAETARKTFKLTTCFGPGRPMFIAFTGISLAKAKKAQTLLNRIEKNTTGVGRTEVLEATYVAGAVTVPGYKRKESRRGGVIFVIPECWTNNIPVLSLYLLIIRTCSKRVQPRKDEDLLTFWKRALSLSSGWRNGDISNVKEILDKFPEMPAVLIKNWEAIRNTQKGIRWEQTLASYGISSLLGNSVWYALASGRRKGETITAYRARYMKGCFKANKALIKKVGSYLITANRKRKKNSEVQKVSRASKA